MYNDRLRSGYVLYAKMRQCNRNASARDEENERHGGLTVRDVIWDIDRPTRR